jgi:hypothetical protein
MADYDTPVCAACDDRHEQALAWLNATIPPPPRPPGRPLATAQRDDLWRLIDVLARALDAA